MDTVTKEDVETLKSVIQDVQWPFDAKQNLRRIVELVEDFENVNDANKKEFFALTSAIGHQADIISTLQNDKARLIEFVKDAKVMFEALNNKSQMSNRSRQLLTEMEQ